LVFDNMSDFRDYYRMLRIGRHATQEEIRQAYRKQAFDLHPDRNPSPGAHARFVLVGEAYQTLGDAAKRGAYNLRYDRQMGLRQGTQASGGASLDMVRRKRASRYHRNGYAPRMRYRGTAASGQPHDFGGEGSNRRPRNSSPRGAYSEAHAERVIEEDRSARQGFRYYASMLRGISGGLLIFCLCMVIDRAMATRSAAETIRAKSEVSWSMTAPGVITLYTGLSHFALKTNYADLFRIGDRVQLDKSPLAKVPVRAYLARDGQLVRLAVYRTRYTGPFLSVWVVIVCCLAMLLFRQNVEFSAYLGTFTMFVALIVLGVILS
jgi:hypothetical protein